MTMRIVNNRILLFVLFLALATMACGLSGGDNAEPTPAPELPADAAPTDPPQEVATVIVVVTPTPQPEAPAPADAPVLEAPTAEPGQPTMTALVDLNVRRGPGTHYGVVGALRAGSSALIVGKSPDGLWWKIECPAGAGSECWASAGAQFSTAAAADTVAVAAVPPAPTVPAQATAVAQVTPTTGATATATTTSQPTATTGAQQPTPTATTAGQPTATATQPPPQATPTATKTATPTATTGAPVAPFDNDSLQNPAVSVNFSPTSNRNFTHNNEVSYPNGDQDDWVKFEFPNSSNTSQNVWITLDCTITGSPNAQLRATVWVNNNATTQIVICNQGETRLTVNNTQVQYLRIHFGITADGIHASYSLRVVGYR